MKHRRATIIITITIIVEVTHMAIMDILTMDTLTTDMITSMNKNTMGISTRMELVNRMGMIPILSPVSVMLARIPTTTTDITSLLQS